ncbi:hypothetical protein GFL38_32645 [Rhizobium leguminosarum bv. viciae]|nr:hypothetical protein [Rhizobium leguminosarum bv. viciae]NKQ74955.1 hypothetical protein [Rhizobium ruizarguesonis]NKQ82040.1 hypothetical protein [Rhizobium ruizarguesonis]
MISQLSASAKQTFDVLAVDDDHLVLMNTVLMLEDLGRTMQAQSAEEALKALAQGPLSRAAGSDEALGYPQKRNTRRLRTCVKAPRLASI